MGLLDKTPWSLECWEPNNQHQLWIEHPSPEDNGYQLLISTCTNWRLSINLQSIQSIRCIHLEKKKKNIWNMSQPFSTQASQQLSGSWCPPILYRIEIFRWRNADFPTLPFTKTISWRCKGGKFTPGNSPSSPEDPHLLEQLWTTRFSPPIHLGIFRPKHRTKLNFSNRKGI